MNLIPKPRRIPVFTAGLLATGMVLFILKAYLPPKTANVIALAGMALFFAGMVVALVGMIRSIRTLADPTLWRNRGVTTSIVTILIAVLAWSGALLTLYKMMQAPDIHVDSGSVLAAETAPAGGGR